MTSKERLALIEQVIAESIQKQKMSLETFVEHIENSISKTTAREMDKETISAKMKQILKSLIRVEF